MDDLTFAALIAVLFATVFALVHLCSSLSNPGNQR